MLSQLFFIALYCVVLETKAGEDRMTELIIEVLNDNHTEFCLYDRHDQLMTCAYRRFEERKSWEAAERECGELGARLPEEREMHDSQMEPLIASVLTQRYNGGLWLGGRHPRSLGVPGEDSAPGLTAESLDVDDHHYQMTEMVHDNSRGPPPPKNNNACGHPPPPHTPGGSRPPKCSQPAKCGMYDRVKGKETLHCSCFEHLPYVCTARKEDGFCPLNGFRECGKTGLCTLTGDSNSNWFRANQVCREAYHKASLPDTRSLSIEVMWALMNCTHIEHTWTLWSQAVWIWNSTGRPINFTNWDSGEPRCPEKDCLVMNTGGKWATGDCGDKRHFICTSNGRTREEAGCADCPLYEFGDYSGEETEPPTNTTRPPTLYRKGARQAIPTSVIIAVVVSLVVVIVITSVVLVVVICRFRRIRQKKDNLDSKTYDLDLQQYQYLQRRNNSIYENDGPDFEVYTELDIPPDQKVNYQEEVDNPGNVYTVQPTLQGQGQNDLEDGIEAVSKFAPRRGSLPATPAPDVVPLSLRKAPVCTEQEHSDYYIQVVPSAYDLSHPRGIVGFDTGKSSKHHNKRHQGKANAGFIKEREEDDEEAYADKPTDEYTKKPLAENTDDTENGRGKENEKKERSWSITKL